MVLLFIIYRNLLLTFIFKDLGGTRDETKNRNQHAPISNDA